MKSFLIFLCYLGFHLTCSKPQNSLFFPFPESNLKKACVTTAGEHGTYELEDKCDQATLFNRIGRSDDIDYKGFVGDSGAAVCCVKRTERVSTIQEKIINRLAGTAAEACGAYCVLALDHVHGGKRADVNEFPHMAALGYFRQEKNSTEFNCGGSLISDRFVLTAAHCCNSKINTPYLVRLGRVSLKVVTSIIKLQ